MLQKNQTAIATFALILVMLLANTSQDGLRRWQWVYLAPAPGLPAAAQSPLTMAQSGVAAKTVRMAVSDVTANLGQKLQQGFEKRQPKTPVNIASTNTTAALQSVATGRADIAVIGRPLTTAEWRQGLVAQTIGRQKIAIIISATNPFTGTLSNAQLAQIWSGKIRNWSALGGPDRAIRVIDQTADSDTRQALTNYSVFQAAVAQPSQGAVTLNDNQIESIAAQLGSDGIAYVVVDQVQARSDLKMVSLYGVLPDDPRYAISQPLSYVYKGPQPNTAVKAFLDYATGPEGKTLAQISTGNVKSKTPETTTQPEPDSGARDANPQAQIQPSPNNPKSSRNGPLPSSWPWLLLALISGFAFGAWLKQKGRSATQLMEQRSISPESDSSVTAMPITTPQTSAATVAGIRPVTMGQAGSVTHQAPSRVILVPRDCHHAYAYWEINPKQRTQLQANGGQSLKLRLYSTSPRQSRNLIQEFDCAENEPDCQIPIALDNYDYYVELGYLTAQCKWLKLATSAPVRVPACDQFITAARTQAFTRDDQPVQNLAASVNDQQRAAVSMVQLATDAIAQERSPSDMTSDYHIHLVPRGESSAYAYWEVPQSRSPDMAIVQPQSLRLYDVTDPAANEPSSRYQQFDCHPTTRDMHLAIPVQGRNYVAEIGYINIAGQWIALARSLNTYVGPTGPAVVNYPTTEAAE